MRDRLSAPAPLEPERDRVPRAPAIALVSWGNVLEDFLAPLGVSLDAFRLEFRGSWIFGYAEALQRVGIRPVLVFFAKGVTAPSRVAHVPTGATMWILPAPRRYRLLERRMVYPYGQTVTQMFGEVRGARRVLLPLYAIVRELALYLATPSASLSKTLRRENCVAILCQEYEYPRFDLCILLGKLTKRPVFACFQGGNYHHSRIERYVRPIAIRACAGLIIGPAAEVDRVRAAYGIPASKIARIFNPVDTDVWKPADREEARASLGIPRSAQVVVWHGRLAMHKKGIDVLLDAWDRLCRSQQGAELRLLLIGTGDDAEELDRRRKASAAPDSVLWIDRFVHEPSTLRRHLAAGDVYVFPSRYEGFPIAPLEAMACGLPLVATDVEGMREILGDGEAGGGLVVPPNDPEALASALRRVLDDALWRQELGKTARRRVQSLFSLEATGESLRSFLAWPLEPA